MPSEALAPKPQPEPKVKTNGERLGYQPRGTKPGRRTDFVNDPQVNARRKEAISRMEAAEQILKTMAGRINPPAPDLPLQPRPAGQAGG